MIINIRGTSGSGKSYCVFKLLEAYPDLQLTDERGKIIAHVIYRNMQPIFFLGPYTAPNNCGCDRINTQNMLTSLVRYYSQFGHVIFEGMIISAHYARYKSLYLEMTKLGMKFMFAYLDTPLDTAIERAISRRNDSNKEKTTNRQGFMDKYNLIHQTKRQFEADGFVTCFINHKKDILSQMEALLDLDSDISYDKSFRKETFR